MGDCSFSELRISYYSVVCKDSKEKLTRVVVLRFEEGDISDPVLEFGLTIKCKNYL